MDLHRKWLMQTAALAVTITAIVSFANKRLFIDPVFETPRLQLPEGTETLIIGASHSACSFDPAQFRHAQNIAAWRELTLFTAPKLRAVLDQNPGVRTVVMAIAPIHLSARQDDHLRVTYQWTSSSQLLNYYGVLGKEERHVAAGWNRTYALALLKYDFGVPLGYASDARIYAKYARGSLTPDEYPFWGKYTPVEGSHLDAKHHRAAVTGRFFTAGASGPEEESGEVAGLSSVSMSQIRRIAEITSERGIRMIFVRTPEHVKFRQATPAFFNRAYAAFVGRLQKDYPSVEYLDL